MKILVTRFSALGDVAMTVPVLQAVATQNDDVEITVVSKPFCAPIFASLPPNVRFEGIDVSRAYRGVNGLRRLVRDCAVADYDAVADLHDVLRTKYMRFYAMLHGVRVAAIDKDRAGRAALVRQKDKCRVQQKTSFEKYADVFRRLGLAVDLAQVQLPVPAVAPAESASLAASLVQSVAPAGSASLPAGSASLAGGLAESVAPVGSASLAVGQAETVTPVTESAAECVAELAVPAAESAAKSAVASVAESVAEYATESVAASAVASVAESVTESAVEFVAESGAPAAESALPAIGVAPFAAHDGKIYPLELMREVVRRLAEGGRCDIYLFGGGQKEREVLEEWETEMPRVRSVAGRLGGLDKELELMSTLRLMLSMDSANMHLASLVGTPVISIWGATHPLAGFMGWRQSEANAIQVDLPCRPCSIFGNKPCLRGDYACLRQITPEQIVAKVNDALAH